MEGEEEVDLDAQYQLEISDQGEGVEKNLEGEEEEVIIGTLSGKGSTSKTLQYKAKIANISICLLVDTGASHSFINPSLAQTLNLNTAAATTLKVRSAGGEKLTSKKICRDVQFSIQGYQFEADLRVMEVLGYDIVLGIDWIAEMDKIELILKKGLVVVENKGKRVNLLSDKVEAEVQVLEGTINVMREVKKGNQVYLAQIFQLEEGSEKSCAVVDPTLATVLDQFQDVFAEPINLPPHRAVDHQIILKAGSQPINIRPYRFSHHQKNEIETIIRELLHQSFIQPSISPYSAPVLLVKKKDSTWRLCIDYRKLNDETVKNKFPIPLIDDLLDELHDAHFFSKLDLRAGYHQIRMAEEDIPKTAFQTHEGLYEFKVMPFGLTNAPATFQALMNNTFKPFLRKFVLVFFYDILIYSKDLESHVLHLQAVLQKLQENQLFCKKSKCEFGVHKIEYLGHIISKEGVATDPRKIKAMVDWPVPKSVKGLRGFLGLTGYYRKFIKGYGVISKVLTDLLKKNCFRWSEAAQQAFEHLKKAMVTSPVLKLPDFQQPFVVETDASQDGIGAVLMQGRRPIAFMSKKLGVKNQALSTYEKELMALFTAVTKWKHYLLGSEFIIKTDQISLKYLLEQRINTPMQHKGLSKLLGLNYRIEYKKGVENKAADALSRQEGKNGENGVETKERGVEGGTETISVEQSNKRKKEAEIKVVSELVPKWVQEVKNSYENDSWIEGLQKKLKDGSAQLIPHHLTEFQGIIRYKGRICVGNQGEWRQKILRELHDSCLGGHSGITATYQRIKRHFFWPQMKESVHAFIQACVNCHLNKPEHVASPGLLQPLPIPSEAWSSIGMDFITGLPKSKGYEVILVVVDRLTKYAHFIGLAHPFTASTVAQAFMEVVYKLHGLPLTIVSDRDPIFTSRFWKELMTKLEVQLNMGTAYHPQSDGQTEKVNQCLEQYLRSMVYDKQTKWAQYLPLAEWWYNSNWHSAIKVSPFEALYGYPPPQLALSSAPRSQVESVNVFLKDRQEALAQLKLNLRKAQERMKRNADKHRSERKFEKGDWVYLKLQPYRQISVGGLRNPKLSPKYYGPFEILKCVGSVAYKLNLPPDSLIHPVFHVSQLKAKLGDAQVPSPELPVLGPGTIVVPTPHLVLDRRMVKRRNAAASQLLIQWKNQSPDDATWEDYEEIVQRFPDFIREDTNFIKGGGMQRGDIELGMTKLIEEDDGSGSRVKKSGQANLERGNTDSRSQLFREGAVVLDFIKHDSWVPLKQIHRGTGEKTGEEE